MQNRKLKPSAETPHQSAPEVPVAIADASTATSVPSPARGLQASLQQQLEGGTATSSAPIPFGWTAVGLVIFCGAFWAAVAYVLS